MIKQLTFNPITAKLDEVSSIPELSSDPSTPSAGDAWVLRQGSGGSGGGKLRMFMGLGFPYVSAGSGGSFTYKFSYQTTEGTTKRVTIS